MRTLFYLPLATLAVCAGSLVACIAAPIVCVILYAAFVRGALSLVPSVVGVRRGR